MYFARLRVEATFQQDGTCLACRLLEIRKAPTGDRILGLSVCLLGLSLSGKHRTGRLGAKPVL